MPDTVRFRGFGLALTALAPLGLACQDLNTPIYFPSPVTPALAVTGANDAMGNPPRAESGLSLRFRNPTKDEQTELDMQQTTLGFDVPWIERDHVHLELLYACTYTPLPNQGPDNDPNDVPTFSLGIDGANEYTKYDENIVAMVLGQGNNDAPQYIPLIPVTPQTIAQNQTISGTVREDDFNEAELDLDGIGKWMSPFNAVLINNSQVNPIGILHFVPPNAVIPALIEVDVNLTSNRNVSCSYQLRVRDDDDQLLHNGTDTLFSPTPTLFVPAVMATTT